MISLTRFSILAFAFVILAGCQQFAPTKRSAAGLQAAPEFDMRVLASGAVNYEPNSLGGPKEDLRFKEPPLKISGDADRYDHRAGNDDYTQAGKLYRLMSADQRKQLIGNIVAAMQGVPREIQERQVAHFTRCDPEYGRGVAGGLKGK